MTGGGQPSSRVVLTLYVSGASPHSAAAVDTLSRLCDAELPGLVDLDVVDVRDDPELVVRDNILAIPTLIRRLPLPERRLVGNLGDMRRLSLGLELGGVRAGRGAATGSGAEDRPTGS
jgi:circadian clock protein KaiB